MTMGKVENQDQLKKIVAKAAIEYVVEDSIIGIGTGSTANYFIDELATIKYKIEGTVASSEASADRLKGHGIPVYDLNAVNEISVYIDGADESNKHLHLIKGGGGALTREKIVAAVSQKFVCIADESKLVGTRRVAATGAPQPARRLHTILRSRQLIRRGPRRFHSDAPASDLGLHAEILLVAPHLFSLRGQIEPGVRERVRVLAVLVGRMGVEIGSHASLGLAGEHLPGLVGIMLSHVPHAGLELPHSGLELQDARLVQGHFLANPSSHLLQLFGDAHRARQLGMELLIHGVGWLSSSAMTEQVADQRHGG